MTSRSRVASAVVRYGVAIAAVALALALRRVIDPWLGTAVPYLLFFPAIMLSAWYGGFGPGVAATVMSAAAAVVYYLPPIGQLISLEKGDALSLALFILIGFMISWMNQALIQAARVQRQAAEEWQTALRSIGDAVVLTDTRGCITFMNGVAERLTGWRAADARGRKLNDVFTIVDDETRTPLASPHERVLKAGVVVGLANHTVLLAKDGHSAAIEDSAAPIRSEYGKITGVVLVFRDVSEKRHAAALLDRAELARQRLAAIVESSDDAIISKDLNGLITSWNRAAERLFGYTAEEAVGTAIKEFIIPPERHAEEDGVLERIRAGELVEHFETVRRRKNGTLVDTAITVSPIKNPSGRIVGASTIARDITDRRHAERVREELLQRERISRAEAVAARDRLHFLADVSALLTSSLNYEETLDKAVHLAVPPLGDYCTVVVQDEGGTLRLVAVAHVVPQKEAIVRQLMQRFLDRPSDSPNVAPEAMRTGRTIYLPRALENPRVQRATSRIAEMRDAGPLLEPLSYLAVPLTVRGRPVGVISFGTSVQESNREYDEHEISLAEEFARRVSLAVENARLFRQADELNRLKDEFLATLSHELRTPLSAILGWARMLKAGQLPGDARQNAVEAIERNAQSQARIVDDILDVARGMAGNVRLEMKTVNFVDVAHAGVEAIAPTAAAKRIVIDVAARSDVPVFGDPARLQQVVWNLLSNAVKFTPHGGSVRIEVEAFDGDAELRVIDSGIGIPLNFLPFVFDKFRQANASFTREHGGLGLGLAIARHLVELHGGTVEARSEGEGRGATFIVRVPLATKRADALNLAAS